MDSITEAEHQVIVLTEEEKRLVSRSPGALQTMGDSTYCILNIGNQNMPFEC